MNRLIQDLLDVARIEAGTLSIEREHVSARDLLAEVLQTQQAVAAAASVRIRLDVQGQLADLWSDRERLVQVFENLIGNAVKFTPPGGQISIGAATRGGEAVFWVADTGSGIAGEDLPRLFDRYWQASWTDKRGAGLGLAIVKGIVEAMGGRIWVQSELNVGTTVFFSVPVVQPNEQPHPGSPPPR